MLQSSGGDAGTPQNRAGGARTMHCLIRLPLVLLLLAVAGACSNDDAGTSGVVRDSAGITIAEHAEPDWSAGGAWTLADSPSVSIGATAGEEPYQLFRVSDVARASDGRIFVLNAGTGEVRIFDAAGTYMRSLGGSGSGPGEFRYPAALWLLAGDSVMVWDSPMGPRVVFSPDGTVGRTEAVDRAAVMSLLGEGRSTEDVRALRDGGLIVAAWTVGSDMTQTEGQLFRPEFELLLVTADLAHATSLGMAGGIEQMFMTAEGRRRPVTVLFSPHYQIATGGSPLRIAVGNGDRYDIRIRDADGSLRQIVRRTTPPARVTAEERDARREEYLAFAESQGRRPMIERMYAAMPDQESFPAHGPLIVDDAGNVWVADFARPSDATTRWTVYDTAGRIAGTVETPIDLQVVEVGADYVLGIARDEDDVERIMLYALPRR
jgi:hypothetical protein